MGFGTTGGGGGPAVLEDPTGRRARWLRRAGRCVSLLFLVWLLAIVLGGLGLMPVVGIPFVHVLQPSQGPPALAKLPQPRQPSASDIRPAVSAKVFAATFGSAGQQTPGSAAGSHGNSATAPGQTKTSPSATAPGQTKTSPSATAPGQTKTSPSATAPGQTKTSPSATAPGQTKTSPSATAPGQTKTTKKP
jgi:hypothetical protein